MAKKRAAQGAGTIRKKTVTRKGKEYTYWEARITVGRDPGTGKQIQRSFSGKTQKEVREKMQAAAVEVNTGTYTAPQKMTVGQWLDIWAAEYMGNLKPSTVRVYTGNINKHIKPALGAVNLTDLHPHTVQTFINGLKGLAPSSIGLAYKVLHTALEKALSLDYIQKNPASKTILPKAKQTEIKPLDDVQVTAILTAARGTRIEHLITVAVFTGFRISELLGLTWDNIDTENRSVTISQQLSAMGYRKKGLFITPKNGKSRTVTPAASVFSALKEQKIKQTEMHLKAGELWDNSHNLVFTMEDGSHIEQWRVTREFKSILSAAGLADVRFHDL